MFWRLELRLQTVAEIKRRWKGSIYELLESLTVTSDRTLVESEGIAECQVAHQGPWRSRRQKKEAGETPSADVRDLFDRHPAKSGRTLEARQAVHWPGRPFLHNLIPSVTACIIDAAMISSQSRLMRALSDSSAFVLRAQPPLLTHAPFCAHRRKFRELL